MVQRKTAVLNQIKEEAQPQPVQEDVWVKTVCDSCRSQCGIKVHRKNGVMVKIEGDPDCPANLGKMCAKGMAVLMAAYDPNRPRVPLKRTNPEKGIGVDPKWVQISWEQALNIISEKLKKIREEDPRKLLLTSFDRAAMQFARKWCNAFGTPNHQWIGYYCGNSLHPSTFLTVATHQQEIDLDHCNYCILFGNQLGFLAGVCPSSMAIKMGDARIRGMKLVVVDPVGSHTAMKADEWLPIRPGTDSAFALGIVNLLINHLHIYDAEFLKKRTNAAYLVGTNGYYIRDEESQRPLVWDSIEGKAKPYNARILDSALEGNFNVRGIPCQPAFSLLKEHVKTYTPEKVAEITTIPAQTISRIAREYGEAASIGAKIVIEGMELPLRPAASLFFRGAIAHKHGSLTGLAIQLMNMTVGNMFVVGGYRSQNPMGPNWAPGESHDGYIIPVPPMSERIPYPPEEVEIPQDLGLSSLYPVATNISPQVQLSLQFPETYKLPYKPEMLIQCRSNIMMSKASPKLQEDALRKIPFIVCFSSEMDETAEFADILLPDAHMLERLDPIPHSIMSSMQTANGYWYWGIRQPVIKPMGESRHWIEVLWELAYRAGFGEDLNLVTNETLHLVEPYRLQAGKKYNLEEMGDRWIKSRFGPQYSLSWLKENGYITSKKTVQENFPGPFVKGRHPIYFEHLKRLGEKVNKVAGDLGIPIDVSDYQPLPEWKPCPGYNQEKDFFAVNYKLPFHTFSFTAENPLLDDLSIHHPYAYKILINIESARVKGLKDGDVVWVESEVGRIKGKIKLTECIHPEVLGIPGIFGSWAQGKPIARGKGPHFNTLVPLKRERMDQVSTGLDACIPVKVYKA